MPILFFCYKFKTKQNLLIEKEEKAIQVIDLEFFHCESGCSRFGEPALGKVEVGRLMPVKALQFNVKATQTWERCLSVRGQRTPAASPTVSEASIQVKPPVATNGPVSAPRTVAVLEPNANTRFHFKQILESAHDFKLAGDFSHLHEVLSHIPRLRPNLLLPSEKKMRTLASCHCA